MSDESYIKSLHQGDEYAFRHIFNLFHTRLCYFASGFLGDTERSRDVVQDAFLKLWERRTDFEGIPAIRSFLYITIKNACLNAGKHEKVVHKYEADQRAVPEEAAENRIIHRLIEAEALEHIHQALQRLPAGCRRVVDLSYFGELRNEEVARQLRVSVNTVKTQKMRAIRILRGLLGESSLTIVLLLIARLH
ncbi:RNA polymerase sigma-70 factor [Compostibacter hankyongensis]|uniref:RNA polymerase sigma-70 factor n=1 Tax=Compostibacter hankyongensis TaxID=1007089 RepID=A0ABP8FSJ7_9BACT